MGILKFDDGVTIDTSGKLRTIKLHDGYYVVGEGMCIPIEDQKEGKQIIKEMQEWEPNIKK